MMMPFNLIVKPVCYLYCEWFSLLHTEVGRWQCPLQFALGLAHSTSQYLFFKIIAVFISLNGCWVGFSEVENEPAKVGQIKLFYVPQSYFSTVKKIEKI